MEAELKTELRNKLKLKSATDLKVKPITGSKLNWIELEFGPETKECGTENKRDLKARLTLSASRGRARVRVVYAPPQESAALSLQPCAEREQ
ncbi:hypothetical protein EVAR_82392_1 [Eumeta japonica]|uniref:Uncharacterized protein n=1 Tax=Eumeta variegata TaxID=151549 RepID=A0A4C1UAW7_EUMVA|nr:hypothetical protein EVAR_82392_1 [Eumeta japonica]